MSRYPDETEKINAILEYLRNAFPASEPRYLVKPDTGSLHVQVFTPEPRKVVFYHDFMGDRDLAEIRRIMSEDAMAQFIRETPGEMDVAVSTGGPYRVERK